jgi:hypothetical protein
MLIEQFDPVILYGREKLQEQCYCLVEWGAAVDQSIAI